LAILLQSTTFCNDTEVSQVLGPLPFVQYNLCAVIGILLQDSFIEFLIFKLIFVFYYKRTLFRSLSEGTLLYIAQLLNLHPATQRYGTVIDWQNFLSIRDAL